MHQCKWLGFGDQWQATLKGHLFRRKLRRSPSGRVTGGSVEFIRVYPADSGVVMVTSNRQQIISSQKGQTGVGIRTISHPVA
jgi:hypothetical protein